LCDSIEKNLDSTIIKMMAIIYSNDQKYRALDEGVPLIGNLLRQHNLDSVNQVLIAKMIEQKKKYLGADIVGYELQDVAFFVIQHADLPYQEKYLPMVEQAIADRNLYKSCYPLLVDRINMDKGIPQIFGTQLTWNKKRDGWELYKVQSMYKINELRKKYDLEPLGDYLKDCHAVIPNKTK
jgi:hypothetical protein